MPVKRPVSKSSVSKSAPAKAPVKASAASKIVASKIPVTAVKMQNAKVTEFKTGDKVVYPAHGVGLIDSIQARRVGPTEAKFYMITIVDTGMKIMVPLPQADTVGLRRVVDSKTIDKVYDILRDRDVEIDTQTWNRRYREYTQKIKTGSVFEIAKVIRDLSVLRVDKELSFGERKMLDTAEGLLVKEISIAKARTEEAVREELQQIYSA